MITSDLKALMGKLDKHCTRVLEAAAGFCVSRSHYEICMEHFLYKLLEDGAGDIPCILYHFGADSGRLGEGLLASLETFKTGNTGRPVFSPLLPENFERAWVLGSVELKEPVIRSGHVLLAHLSRQDLPASTRYMNVLDKVDLVELKRRWDDITADSTERIAYGMAPDAPARPDGGAAPGPIDAESALGRYTIDITGQARAGHIDPVFGRDREIREMIDILARRRKNNPIVVGEAGVGKTAIVEGLALRVVENDVPDILLGVEIRGLDMGLLQAGASVKGEFENRLKSVIDEVKASPTPLILFIDEAHTLIGAGGPAGGGDAANLLKPALARGELRTVAATTWSEYKKYFEKDVALARRFQVIKLEEPSALGAVDMMRGLRSKYETAHGVSMLDEAVVSASVLSDRYISGRQLPDKAVDLLDTAAARIRIGLTAKPGDLDDLERRIVTLERELNSRRADAGNDPVELAALDDLEKKIKAMREEADDLHTRWRAERDAVAEVRRLEEELKAALAGDSTETSEPEPEPEKKAKVPEPEAKTPEAEAQGQGMEAEEQAPPRKAEDIEADLSNAKARLAELQGDAPIISTRVDSEAIARVVQDWTGIPVTKMVGDEAKTLLELEKKLSDRIRGQDHALQTVAQGIRSAKAGLKPPETPIGVFLFVGPSGVGKTETGLGVADLLFGGERFMVTINMSEFQEKHTVSRLIGSPPGYVGYGEGGVLTEAVRQRPYSVVLLDEVEKADLEVMNLFYQVFDKGMLSDGEGRLIDFKNTVVFLTSNLATDAITELSLRESGPPTPEELAKAIRPILSRHFKPALLARMTIVPFFPIGPEVMSDIVRLKLGKMAGRLKANQHMDLTYTAAVVDTITARCTEVEAGARNVDHILRSTLMPQISEQILSRMTEDNNGDTGVEVDVNPDQTFKYSFI